MKITKFFLMAALALTFAACSNDDNDFQNSPQPAKAEGIPFTATISVAKSAATRALEDKGTKIEATWADKEVALIYDAGGTPTKTNAEVTKQADGTATISATLASGATDGSEVTIIYPATAADDATGNVKADLLYAQDGTLTGTSGTSIAEKYDVRKGNGKLSINGGKATVNNGTAGTNVSLTNQFAIFKFDVKNADATASINVKPLTITIGAQNYVITPSSATSTLYAVLPAVSGKTVNFSATGSDSKTYVFSKDNVTFTAGKYYASTLGMKKGVIWTNSDFSSGSGYSFTKDGITMSVNGAIIWEEKDFMGEGTFTSSVGNFKKIEVTAKMFESMGSGWSVTNLFDNSKATWTGNASTVNFADNGGVVCGIEGHGGPVTMVFTLE